MTNEKWHDIIAMVKEKFEILEHRKDPLELPDLEKGAFLEYIIFHGPLGKIRLERRIQPLVLDKQTLGSRRVGSETKIKYTYSATETFDRFTVYRWDEAKEDWIQIKAEAEAFNL